MSQTSSTPNLRASGIASTLRRITAPLQLSVRASLGTLPGVLHDINQDTISHLPGHFSGIADGVGGGAHGEIASRMLLQMLPIDLPKDEASASQILATIDQRITEVLSKLGDGPGATVFAAIWPLSSCLEWQVLWVGDCQVTHYQSTASVWQISWQSLAQTYKSSFTLPPPGVDLESPSNMVGCGISHAPAWYRLTARARDRIVIASDGFHKSFTASEKLGFLQNTATPLPSETAQKWCLLARERGNQDDISVLILEIVPKIWLSSVILLSTFALMGLVFSLYWFAR